jgi:hypothetical protein
VNCACVGEIITIIGISKFKKGIISQIDMTNSNTLLALCPQMMVNVVTKAMILLRHSATKHRLVRKLTGFVSG